MKLIKSILAVSVIVLAGCSDPNAPHAIFVTGTDNAEVTFPEAFFGNKKECLDSMRGMKKTLEDMFGHYGTYVFKSLKCKQV